MSAPAAWEHIVDVNGVQQQAHVLMSDVAPVQGGCPQEDHAVADVDQAVRIDPVLVPCRTLSLTMG